MSLVKKKSSKKAKKKKKKKKKVTRKKKAARAPKRTIISRNPLIVRYGSGKVPREIIETEGPPCPGASDLLLEDRGP